ncbi:MAG: hypothetical protein JW880_05040 [Candidatus Thermoplasmatota archaeon]|nr:hypothetical protein [Candidatus Thermoplasmatota archaeon]
MAEIKKHDIEMRAMYENNKDRFGHATLATAILSGLVLAITGIAGVATTIEDWTKLGEWLTFQSAWILVCGGAAIPFVVEMYWLWARWKQTKTVAEGRCIP